MQQQQGQWQETPDSFSNKLEGEHFRTYLQNELSYRKNELTLTAALPLSWQHISLNDGDLNHGQQMSRLLFDPRLSADYRISDNNLIYSNQVQPDGTTILQAFEQPNTGYMHTINGQTSKYFSAAKSTISFRASYSNNRRQSLLNNQLFETSNQFVNLSPQINTRITEWLRGEYRAYMSYIQTYIGSMSSSNISMLRHYLDFHVFPRSGHYLGLTTEYYRHRDNENFFTDLLYRYSIKKHRIDIEARWLNMFNANTYITYQSSAFTVSENTYFLRPSQVLLSVRFSF